MAQTTRFTIDPGWKLILKDLGLSISEFLRAARLPGDLFSREAPSLSTEEHSRFWTTLEALMDSPEVPLTLGQSISVEAFNAPLFAAFTSPNLEVCFGRLSRFKRLMGPMALHVHKDRGEVSLEMEFLGGRVPVPSFLIATEFVFLVHLVRTATRHWVRPRFVQTQTGLTGAAYAEFFGVRPVVGDRYKLGFSAGDARRPFLTENETMWRFFEPELNKRLHELETGTTFAERVRAAMTELLPSGRCTIADAAEKLAIGKRTLQRHLYDENTTFQDQLDQTRAHLAKHYLAHSTLTGSEIACLLGYDDANSFSRGFHHWSGQTPEAFRRGKKGPQEAFS